MVNPCLRSRNPLCMFVFCGLVQLRHLFSSDFHASRSEPETWSLNANVQTVSRRSWTAGLRSSWSLDLKIVGIIHPRFRPADLRAYPQELVENHGLCVVGDNYVFFYQCIVGKTYKKNGSLLFNWLLPLSFLPHVFLHIINCTSVQNVPSERKYSYIFKYVYFCSCIET